MLRALLLLSLSCLAAGQDPVPAESMKTIPDLVKDGNVAYL